MNSRLLTLFTILLCVSTLFSQSEDTKKPKRSLEIGANFLPIMRGKAGAGGFMKISLSQSKSLKSLEKQNYFKISSGFISDNLPDRPYNPKNDIFINSIYRSEYSYSKSTCSRYFLAFGFEQNFKKGRHNFWYGFDIGPSVLKKFEFVNAKSFKNNILTREYFFTSDDLSIGGRSAVNIGYKYEITKNIGIGLNLSVSTLAVLTKGLSKYDDGTTFKKQLTEVYLIDVDPNGQMLFMSFKF
jgi:hypothetical protein